MNLKQALEVVVNIRNVLLSIPVAIATAACEAPH